MSEFEGCTWPSKVKGGGREGRLLTDWKVLVRECGYERLEREDSGGGAWGNRVSGAGGRGCH